MRVDLKTDDEELAAIPRFQLATNHARQLFSTCIAFAGLAFAILLMWLIVDMFAPTSIWIPIQLNAAATLLILLASFQSAWRIAVWRARIIAPEELTPEELSTEKEATHPQPDTEQTGKTVLKTINPIKQLSDRIKESRIKPILSAIGIDVTWVVLLILFAFLLIDSGWNLSATPKALGANAYLFGGLALLVAFALLVVERYLAAHKQEWPEALPLAVQLRVAIVVFVLSAICLFYANAERIWPLRLAVLVGLLPCLLGLELIIRAILVIFTPRRDSLEPALFTTSFFAEMMRWPPKPMQLFQASLHQRFGIDLRQVWAFGFIRRAFLPILLFILLAGWLLSGLHEIPMNGRGIYERFGKPVAVLKPGLHVSLPWPFGRIINVEYGVVHELAASTDDNSTAPAIPNQADPTEGPAPYTANRLWDVTHRSEKSQIIASSSDGKQSFQIVDMDVRFIYRIGLTDEDALKATYNTDNLPMLIRRTASRVLVHDFAGRTLDDLLSEQRNQLAADVDKAVQSELNRLNSGVTLLATAIEAIHPPAKAANAYHKVQSAQIEVQALIAREKGKAAVDLNQAEQKASLLEDDASAKAHQNISQANIAKTLFTADKHAYDSAGKTFIREQYYQQLAKGMKNANSLIIDSRIQGTGAPTIDFRSFVPPVDPKTNTSTQSGETH
ncbi:FtsH protease regulator HflK [Marinomonas spartinae]|uniref:protease modulator HflK n=1 Tax=Marinomonas spartinae TaxID=1792290 RepID=UPI000808ADE0|nr:protease modulator HflK [Marinomonas spartinae]SBS38780.1 FtsH protease regulator HflK [Marinomonas spartinae]